MQRTWLETFRQSRVVVVVNVVVVRRDLFGVVVVACAAYSAGNVGQSHVVVVVDVVVIRRARDGVDT